MSAGALPVSFSESEAAWCEEISALRERLGTDPSAQTALLACLHESHPAYRGRGAEAVVRMRGWILLALAAGEWSEALERYVLEELDNGSDTYLIGVAGAVLRQAASPDARFAPFLLRALNIVRWHDDEIQLTAYGGYAICGSSTTALREILIALEWLGSLGSMALPTVLALNREAEAWPERMRLQLARTLEALQQRRVDARACGCRSMERAAASPATRTPGLSLGELELEDQFGRRLRFGEFFFGRPALLTFFYTRCSNPLKCSATIERMAKLHDALRSAQLLDRVRTAALTYDPAYDQATLLRAYGASRGWQFDDNHRLLRTVGDFAQVGEALQLGVNFQGSVVNRHRLEALIFHPNGRILDCIEQVTWATDDLVERLGSLAALA